MRRVEFTHSGWFWFCPVLWAEDGMDGCIVEARWAWLEWLFSACEVLEAARIWLSGLINPDYEPTFGFRVRRLPQSIIRTQS